jgi:hypothetical protein
MDFTLKVVGGDISAIPGLDDAIQVCTTHCWPPSFRHMIKEMKVQQFSYLILIDAFNSILD